MADGLRSELWAALGMNEPMSAAQAVAWLATHESAQERTGDRIRTRPGVDVFAGVYLDADLTDPQAGVWPDERSRSGVQPLALLSLAVITVSRATGCSLAEAADWLLCDVPIRARSIRIYASGGFPGGLSLWVPDPTITAEDLGRRLSSARGSASSRKRSRQPVRRTGVLIDFVRARRPHPGRHPGNMPWSELLGEWNAERPAWAYADDGTGDSISRAYAAAVKRRQKLMMLPASRGF
jgi:hypothetical protein